MHLLVKNKFIISPVLAQNLKISYICARVDGMQLFFFQKTF